MPRINTNRPIPPKYTRAEKGKAIAEEPSAASFPKHRKFERGETSGTAQDKPLPGHENRPGAGKSAPASDQAGNTKATVPYTPRHNSDSESTESFLTSDSGSSSSFRSEGHGGDDGSPQAAGEPGARGSARYGSSDASASLKHYIPSSESESGWGSMTLADYMGPLTGGGSTSGSSGSGSDVLAGAGFNVNRIMQKNGRLANLESQAMTPKRDPKFERTVENSPGYQRDFNPDNYQRPRRPLNYLHETQSPFASLPPAEREAWTDNPRYMPRHELAKRYDEVKRDKAELTAENTRLQEEVQALQGQIGEVHADAAHDAKTSKLSGAVVGGIAGVTVGTIAGIVIGSGSAPQNPQTPTAP